jgi:hypothetical protein
MVPSNSSLRGVRYSGYMDRPQSARIAILRRYISLLKQEEKRLMWAVGRREESEHSKAEAALRENDLKLTKAEEELQKLEGRRRPRRNP